MRRVEATVRRLCFNVEPLAQLFHSAVGAGQQLWGS